MTERGRFLDPDVVAKDTEPSSFYEYLLQLAADLPGMYEDLDGDRTLFDIPDAVSIPVCMPMKNHTGEVNAWKVSLIVRESNKRPVNTTRLFQLIESQTLRDYGLALAGQKYIFETQSDEDAQGTELTTLNYELEFRSTKAA